MTEVTAYHTEHHNQFDLIYAQTLIAGPSGLQLPSVVSPDGISWSVSAGSHLSGAPGSIVEALLEAFSDGQNTEDTLSAGPLLATGWKYPVHQSHAREVRDP